MKLNIKLVKKGAASFGLSLTDTHLSKFSRYCELLLHFNQKFNLTAIINPDEVASKHFVDSLACVLVLNMNCVTTMADIGAGAGLPGFALKIAFPAIKLIAIESIRKKAQFLKTLVKELELENTMIINNRAEDVLNIYPELNSSFELVTARAVGKLGVLLDYAKPILKTGGSLVLWKGRDEVSNLPSEFYLLKQKGFELVKTVSYKIPLWKLERFIIHLIRL